MAEYVIATSSTCDIDCQWLKENNVPFISYSIIIDGKEYKDDCSDATKDFVLSEMKQDRSVSTAAISEYAYEEFFRGFAEKGLDVLMLDMTKALSSSYNNCVIAARNIQEEYPNIRIHAVDTNCETAILGLLVKGAVAKKNEGCSFEETEQWCEENKNRFVGRFMVDDLKWLRRGGRLSNASAIVGSILSVKPLIYVDHEGKLIAYEKVRGSKKAIRTLIESAATEMDETTGEFETAIIYSGEREEGENFLAQVQEAYPQLKHLELYRLGPTIMGHIGPGFLAIVIHGSERTM